MYIGCYLNFTIYVTLVLLHEKSVKKAATPNEHKCPNDLVW